MDKYLIVDYTDGNYMVESIDGFSVNLTDNLDDAKKYSKQEAEYIAERFGLYVKEIK